MSNKATEYFNRVSRYHKVRSDKIIDRFDKDGRFTIIVCFRPDYHETSLYFTQKEVRDDVFDELAKLMDEDVANENELDRLRKENAELQLQVRYMPNGTGYEEAKQDFEKRTSASNG